MINTINSTYSGGIQPCTPFTAAQQLSEGTCLQSPSESSTAAGQTPRYDTLELSSSQSQATLDVPDEITIDIPRSWTIMSETMKSHQAHLQWSLDEADNRNLSFGERLTFLREEGQKWVEDKRQNDPDMFAAWLQMHKDAIQAGEGHLVGLPADFTMEDYYHYVKEPFSTLA